MDLPYILDPRLPTALHDQLTNAIKADIDSGRLKPGQALPSTRALAESLGISRDTVMRSYEDLASLGFLVINSRSSTCVSDKPPRPSARLDQPAENANIDLSALSDFTRRLMSIHIEAASAVDQPGIHYGAAPPSLLPVQVWRKLLSRYCAPDTPDQLIYTEGVFGSRPLREEICRYLNHSRGMNCQSEQVVVLSNSQLPLALSARALVNSGDLVALENPCHSGAREIFLSLGARLAYLPIDEHGLIVSSLHDLKERCKILYVTPSHQDPTGVTMPLERRKALLSWAAKNCDYVIEDGFDSDYFYAPPRLPALAALDSTQKVLHIYSFWKLLFPLVTTASLVLPKHLIPAFLRIKSSVDRDYSLLDHHILADFLSQGHLEKHVHKTRAIYQRRRQALIFALSQCFRTELTFFGDGAGLHLTVRLNLPLDCEEILSCAKTAGLPLVSTSGYYSGNPAEQEFLISFAGLPEKQARPTVERFAAALGRRR